MMEGAETTVSSGVIEATVHDRIIPRLLRERNCVSGAFEASVDHSPRVPDDADIRAFAGVLLKQPESEAIECFDRLLEAGVPVTTLFIDVLSGAARVLGEQWVKDECSFAEVTLGLTILHRLLHRHSHCLVPELPTISGDHAIFITPVPGENHIFAAAMLGEFFRAAGWRVRSGVHEKPPAILRHIGSTRFDVVGITVSSSRKLGDCEKLIDKIRGLASSNQPKIIVGGPPFVTDPQAHKAIGADATALDAITALKTAAMICEAIPTKAS